MNTKANPQTASPFSLTRQIIARILILFARIAMAVLAIPIALVIFGTFYQTFASKNERQKYPPPGQLFDVGDYRLHIYCLGEGSPTVILESANMGTVSNWIWIQPEIAKMTRVCAYDRSAIGWSDISPEPQDTRQNSQALHTLLEKAKIPAPYVLVSHSLGALYARMYAEMYPEEIAGAVFIEGTHPDAFKAQGLPDAMPNAPDQGFIDASPFVSQFGLLRLVGLRSNPDLPERQYKELQAYLYSTKWAELIKRQYHLFPTLLAQVRPLYAPGSLGDIPLAVVLGTNGDGGNPALTDIFQQQAALSTNSKMYWIDGADHISITNRQEFAAKTSIAILNVLEAAKKTSIK